MAKLVVMGAPIQCSFGVAPSALVAAAPHTVTYLPIATVNDNVPITNIPPFSMCTSMSNPTVSAATSAALGVLTPMPCVPVTSSPWSPGAVKTKVGKKAALTDACKLNCSYGGVISINSAGQTKVDVS